MNFDDYDRRGDYLIPSDLLEEAEREFAKRGPRSRAVDRSMRGSITTDYEKWKRLRGRGVDFPGVDTPTKHPRSGVTDQVGVRERARMAAGNPDPGDSGALLVEDPATRRRGPSVVDLVSETAERTWIASGELANVIQPGTVARE